MSEAGVLGAPRSSSGAVGLWLAQLLHQSLLFSASVKCPEKKYQCFLFSKPSKVNKENLREARSLLPKGAISSEPVIQPTRISNGTHTQAIEC